MNGREQQSKSNEIDKLSTELQSTENGVGVREREGEWFQEDEGSSLADLTEIS